MTGDNNSSLGKILKQRRLMMPLTLQELGSAARVSSSHLGRIERGERFPSARILRRLAQPLHMEESELMSLAGYLSPEPTAAWHNARPIQLDPYVSMVLSQEPVEVQRAMVAVLTVLKGMAKSFSPGPDGKSEENK
jgi:transcriptional regulator with XRE-family HTH domain